MMCEESESESESESGQVDLQALHGPCLAIGHGNELTLFDASLRKYHSRILPEVANIYMHGCYGDWLLLQEEDYETCYLLNVLTMEKVELPALEGVGCINLARFLLSDNDSRFFLFNDFECLRTCKIGATEFTKQDDIKVKDAILIQGKMYTVSHSYDLFYAEWLEEEEEEDDASPRLQLTELIPGFDLWGLFLFQGYRYAHLIESPDHQLWVVNGHRLGQNTVDFQIFRADLEEKRWEEVDDIGGDHAIFVDGRRGFLAPVIAGSEVKGNCIYYVDEHDEDEFGTVYAYHLQDRCITMLSSLPFEIHADPAFRWLYIN